MKCCSRKGEAVTGRRNPLRSDRQKGWGKAPAVHQSLAWYSLGVFSHSCFSYTENAEMLLLIPSSKKDLLKEELILDDYYCS